MCETWVFGIILEISSPGYSCEMFCWCHWHRKRWLIWWINPSALYLVQLATSKMGTTPVFCWKKCFLKNWAPSFVHVVNSGSCVNESVVLPQALTSFVVTGPLRCDTRACTPALLAFHCLLSTLHWTCFTDPSKACTTCNSVQLNSEMLLASAHCLE